MEIKKAIITAAGKNQRTLPLQSLVDRDGVAKTALRILIEEVLQAGIEEIAVVISPGDQKAYETAAGNHASRLTFVEQSNALGYGHAVYCAKDFAARNHFLLLVGDHLYVSRSGLRCAQQLVQTARQQECAVSAVQATHEGKLTLYGAVGGRLVPGPRNAPRGESSAEASPGPSAAMASVESSIATEKQNASGLYEIDQVLEKPTPTEAEQRIIVPGLRAGYYLCFFGMHILPPTVMDLLSELVQQSRGETVSLTAALARMAARERYLAYEVAGRRYDIGLKYGLLTAQLALALEGQDRDEVLTGLVELLAKGTK